MSLPRCPKCKAEIRDLPQLEPGVEARIRELARFGDRPVMAIAELRAATGWELGECKAWVVHKGQPCPPTGSAPCPHCGKPLRTEYAKQCRHCKRLLDHSSTARPSDAVLYFEVADIHEAHSSLMRNGVEFDSAPRLIYRDDGGTFGPVGGEEWMAFFKDPDGNVLALASRIPASSVD